MNVDLYRFMDADQFLSAHLDKIPEDLRPRIESCLLRPSKVEFDDLEYQLMIAQDRVRTADREISDLEDDRDFLASRVHDLEKQVMEYLKEEQKQSTLFSRPGDPLDVL